MAKEKSFGVQLSVNAETILGLTDITLPEVEVTDIDVTTHDSAGGYKEYIGGLKDGGVMTISGAYDIADEGQIYLRLAANQGGDPVACVVTFSDGSTATFEAVVKGYGVSNPLDDKISFTASFRISGPIVYAADVP